MTTKEARGLIPRHPNCRCVLIPANVGEPKDDKTKVNFRDPRTGEVKTKEVTQKRTKGEVDRAFKKSLKAEGKKDPLKESKWVGADKKIAKTRPKSVVTPDTRERPKTPEKAIPQTKESRIQEAIDQVALELEALEERENQLMKERRELPFGSERRQQITHEIRNDIRRERNRLEIKKRRVRVGTLSEKDIKKAVGTLSDFGEPTATGITLTEREINKQAESLGKLSIHGMSKEAEVVGVEVGDVLFIWEPDTSRAAAKTIANVFSSENDIPENLLSSVGQVVITNQRNEADARWAKRYKIPGFQSAATGGDGTTVIYNGSPLGVKSYSHEAGHSLADTLWNSTTPPSNSDFGQTQTVTKTGRIRKGNAVSTYGQSSAAEDFAETAGLFVVDPGRLKQDHPEKYEAFKKLMEQ
jgi:hypothetical protein